MHAVRQGLGNQWLYFRLRVFWVRGVGPQSWILIYTSGRTEGSGSGYPKPRSKLQGSMVADSTSVMSRFKSEGYLQPYSQPTAILLLAFYDDPYSSIYPKVAREHQTCG